MVVKRKYRGLPIPLPKSIKLSAATKPIYRIYGLKWQLNLVAKELDKYHIVHAFISFGEDNRKEAVVVQPVDDAEMVQTVMLVSSSKAEYGQLVISRIDFVIDDDRRGYLVMNSEIREECIRYAVENKMLDEEFIEESEGCWRISRELMEKVGYVD